MGSSLERLHLEGEIIDSFLRKSHEFNARFDNPEAWQAELRTKQKEEGAEHSKMRDRIKVRMVLKEALQD